jgi:hypothetical protein
LLLSKSATIAALMAIIERRNDRPAASARSGAEDGGLSDLVAARGMPPLGGREEDRERAIAGKGRRVQRAYCGA